MVKLIYVAIQEYRRNVFKKGFILVLLSVPLIMGLNIGVGFFLERVQDNDLPVGYIDKAGILSEPSSITQFNPQLDRIKFIPFLNESDARESLERNEIQAYIVVGKDYFKSRRVDLFFVKKPGENAVREFYDFLQFNLLTSQSPEIAYRASDGTDVAVRSIDGRREVPDSGPTFGILMPLMVNLSFLALLMISSDYMMSAVSEEKENRTIEVLVTTLSPAQIIIGKVMGILAIGITLLTTWTLVILASIRTVVGAGIGWFQDLSFDWGILLATVAIGLPAYVLSAALMTTIGSMATTSKEGSSLSTVFVVLHLLPLYVSIGLFKNHHSYLAVVLSLLPFTSLLTVAMRNLFTIVPAWQVAVSVVVQVVSAVFALWLAARAFRLGMLRYGQRLTWRNLFNLLLIRRGQS